MLRYGFLCLNQDNLIHVSCRNTWITTDSSFNVIVNFLKHFYHANLSTHAAHDRDFDRTVTHMNMYSTVHSIKWWGRGSLDRCLPYIWHMRTCQSPRGLHISAPCASCIACRVSSRRRPSPRRSHCRSARSRSATRPCAPEGRWTGAPRSWLRYRGWD